MSSKAFITSGFIFLSIIFHTSGQSYFPEKSQWETKNPSSVGLKEKQLLEAVEFAKANEYSGNRDLRIAILEGFKREPYHEILGPTKKRGGPAGVILKDGYIVAQWGDVERVDMTFSVTKSYLSTVAGLAVDQGLIKNTQDRASAYVWDGTYDGPHNESITWHQLLNQSSAWSGTLFGIKDWGDRPPSEGTVDDWKFETPNAPGTVMEYNDVRVNLLAYSLLQVWRKPMPMVLKEQVMDRIDASTTWRWFGYRDAWATVDGLKMKSVTGGGHSGGGIFINTLDHARFGLLFQNNGKWKEEQIISSSWIEQATTSSEAHESYGYMWWLNKGPRKWEQVDDESIFYAAGFGGNFIVVDQTNNMVIVTRWLEPSQIGKMVGLIQASLK
jgi:CubicO group peptidase (beta-lactamase class C family)